MHVLDDALKTMKRLGIERRRADRLRMSAHAAKRFIVDPSASAWIMRFSRECRDLLAQNIEFAIPPYEDTYIEVIDEASHPRYEDTFGFLFDRHGAVYSMVRLDESNGPVTGAFTPFHYDPASPQTITHRLLTDDRLGSGEAETIAERLYFGKVLKDVDRRVLWRLAMRYPVSSLYGTEEETSRTMLDAQSGELSVALSALLLLNQRRNVELVQMPARRVIRRGKSRPFAAHTRVSINLEPDANPRRAFQVTDRASPRRHAVRGHFMHFSVADGCAHQWEEAPGEDGPRRWVCAHCGGRRVWRAPFHRGDAGIGYVTKDYAITGGPA